MRMKSPKLTGPCPAILAKDKKMEAGMAAVHAESGK